MFSKQNTLYVQVHKACPHVIFFIWEGELQNTLAW